MVNEEEGNTREHNELNRGERESSRIYHSHFNGVGGGAMRPHYENERSPNRHPMHMRESRETFNDQFRGELRNSETGGLGSAHPVPCSVQRRHYEHHQGSGDGRFSHSTRRSVKHAEYSKYADFQHARKGLLTKKHAVDAAEPAKFDVHPTQARKGRTPYSNRTTDSYDVHPHQQARAQAAVREAKAFDAFGGMKYSNKPVDVHHNQNPRGWTEDVAGVCKSQHGGVEHDYRAVQELQAEKRREKKHGGVEHDYRDVQTLQDKKRRETARESKKGNHEREQERARERNRAGARGNESWSHSSHSSVSVNSNNDTRYTNIDSNNSNCDNVNSNNMIHSNNVSNVNIDRINIYNINSNNIDFKTASSNNISQISKTITSHLNEHNNRGFDNRDRNERGWSHSHNDNRDQGSRSRNRDEYFVHREQGHYGHHDNHAAVHGNWSEVHARRENHHDREIREAWGAFGEEPEIQGEAQF